MELFYAGLIFTVLFLFFLLWFSVVPCDLKNKKEKENKLRKELEINNKVEKFTVNNERTEEEILKKLEEIGQFVNVLKCERLKNMTLKIDYEPNKSIYIYNIESDNWEKYLPSGSKLWIYPMDKMFSPCSSGAGQTILNKENTADGSIRVKTSMLPNMDLVLDKGKFNDALVLGFVPENYLLSHDSGYESYVGTKCRGEGWDKDGYPKIISKTTADECRFSCDKDNLCSGYEIKGRTDGNYDCSLYKHKIDPYISSQKDVKCSIKYNSCKALTSENKGKFSGISLNNSDDNKNNSLNAEIKTGSANDKYVDMFNKIGCPNSKPNTSWWQTQEDDVVLDNMYSLCESVKDGKATNWQKDICCGEDNKDCKITACQRQPKLQTNNINSGFSNSIYTDNSIIDTYKIDNIYKELALLNKPYTEDTDLTQKGVINPQIRKIFGKQTENIKDQSAENIKIHRKIMEVGNAVREMKDKLIKLGNQQESTMINTNGEYSGAIDIIEV